MENLEKSKSSFSEIKKICTILAVCLLFAILIFFTGFFLAGHTAQSKPVITGTTISQQIQQISNLATTEYEYTNVGKFENNSTFQGFQIPFTKKSFLLTYSGKITAGIHLENLKVNIIPEEKIIITLPKAEILTNEIDEKSIEVYDETKNIFNQISVQDYAAFATEQKSLMEEKALQKGILTKAEEKAKDIIIRTLQINPEIAESYIIEFQSENTNDKSESFPEKEIAN